MHQENYKGLVYQKSNLVEETKYSAANSNEQSKCVMVLIKTIGCAYPLCIVAVNLGIVGINQRIPLVNVRYSFLSEGGGCGVS